MDCVGIVWQYIRCRRLYKSGYRDEINREDSIMIRHIKKGLQIGLVASLSSVVGAVTAMAVTWEMPTPYPDATFHTVNIKQFAEDVKAATNGQLTINVHSAGSLFKHPEIKKSVRGGQVPIGEFFMGLLANEDPVFAMDTLPFLATDYDAARKLWEVTKPKVSSLLEKQGLRVLFSVPWPPQGLYTKKLIDKASDLKGIKFRAYNTSTTRLAELAGAVPTQIEVADLAQAFATGRVQAMITSPSTGVSSKAWDFLSHFHHTQAWIPKNVVVINQEAFSRLDGAVQKAVLDAAAKAEARGWQMSMAETDEKIAILKKNGVSIITPSANLMGSLKTIGQTMSDEWSKKAGAEGQALLSAYRN
jgi:TRAP-type C4-dicarboxylate transport system substrate-binding protein